MVNRRCGKVVSPSYGRRAERTGKNIYGKNRICFGFCALILVLFFAGCKSLPTPSESADDLPVEEPVFPLEEVTLPSETVSGETPAVSGVTEQEPVGSDAENESFGESGDLNDMAVSESLETAEEVGAETGVSEEPSLVFPGLEQEPDSGSIQTEEAAEPENSVTEVPVEPETATVSPGPVSGFQNPDVPAPVEEFVPENSGAATPGSGLENASMEDDLPESGAQNISQEEIPLEQEVSDPFEGVKDSDIPGIWEDTQPGVIFLPEAEQSVEPFHLNVSMGQNLEVLMPGSGWVYMGQEGDSGALDFKGKNIRDGDTVFLFGTKNTGVVDLEFSRFDVIRDSYDDRKITVDINNDQFSGSTVVWKEEEAPDILSSTVETEVAAPKEITLDTNDSAAATLDSDSPVSDEPGLLINTGSETSDDSYKSLDSGSMLDSMEKALAEGNIPLVQEIADYYPVAYSIDLDRMWYILGQAYEADTDYRDIKKSLNAYETVIKAYPFSKYWSKSKDRISYINRYFFNIR